jgi:hypothetical protein
MWEGTLDRWHLFLKNPPRPLPSGEDLVMDELGSYAAKHPSYLRLQKEATLKESLFQHAHPFFTKERNVQVHVEFLPLKKDEGRGEIRL